MHDIDRTQRELEMAMQEFQSEYYEYAGETADEWTGESDEFEGVGYSQEAWNEAELYETGLSQEEEMEMALELLEVTNEMEMDHFLGKLIRRAGKSVGRKVPSPLGRALGKFLKPIAKVALPIAGKALGTMVGGPIGGKIGGRLASAAGRMFGLELEGLSAEDREFEIGKRFVQLAFNAARNTARTRANASPRARAKGGLMAAMRKFAPGLRQRLQQRMAAGPPQDFNYAQQLPMDQPAFGDPYSPDAGGDPYGNVGATNSDGYGDSDPYSASMQGGDFGSPGGDYAQMPDYEQMSEAAKAGGKKRGTWVRRGNRIVLYGV